MSQLAQEYTSHSSIFRHQTICVESINIIIIIVNSQVTKARDYFYNNHYNFKFFNPSTIIRLFQHIMSVLIRWKFEFIRQLVGTSEAIRLILVFIELKLINLISKLSVLKKQCPGNKHPILSLCKVTNNKHCLVFSRKMSTNELDNSNNTKYLKNIAFKE